MDLIPCGTSLGRGGGVVGLDHVHGMAGLQRRAARQLGTAERCARLALHASALGMCPVRALKCCCCHCRRCCSGETSLCDGVRDVDLAPAPSTLVAAVLDNGSMELWDWQANALVCRAGLAKGGRNWGVAAPCELRCSGTGMVLPGAGFACSGVGCVLG